MQSATSLTSRSNYNSTATNCAHLSLMNRGLRMRKFVLVGLVCAAGLAALPGVSAHAKQKNAGDARLFSRQIPKDQKITQALNRLTFGPRPGDAARGSLHRPEEVDRPPASPRPDSRKPRSDREAAARSTRSRCLRQRTGPELSDAADGPPDGGGATARSPPTRTAACVIERLVARSGKKAGQRRSPPTFPKSQPIADLLTPPQIRTLRTGTPQAAARRLRGPAAR